MPIVQLYYKDGEVSGENLNNFTSFLAGIVASQMTIDGSGADIDSKSIRILTSKISVYDRNAGCMVINIFAHPYPERVETKKERVSKIKRGVGHFLKTLGIESEPLVHMVFADIEIA